MRRWLSGLTALLFAAAAAAAEEPVRHHLTVELEPGTALLTVTDRITLPEAYARQGLELLLNGALRVSASEPPLEEMPVGQTEGVYGLNGSSLELRDPPPLARYRLRAAPTDGTLTLTYVGVVEFQLSAQEEEYTRGFRETAGLIGEEGVFLAAKTFWYPTFDDRLVEFVLEAEAPPGWHLISQGAGTSRDAEGRARWDSEGAMDEIYLVGGPLTLYRDSAGAVETLVYLRQEDEPLAGKYLTTTAQYLELYRQLIGTYPYSKFALVENFWETGYGMPSFTLLGPTVIRFPFILHSSYPHEILHNWWGNSVFVDFPSGNWSEGLTAYLADHLVQEQRGKGSEYRRATLQKYRNYVREERDFPLSQFRSRHSAATEAVGYGKTLMGFHMLRRRLGNEAFRSALAGFYRSFRGRRASFDDLQAAFERAGGEPLQVFFDQWVRRPGAAELEVRAEARPEGDGHLISGLLTQRQESEPFALDVPLAVQTDAGREDRVVRLEGKSAPFEIRTAARPLLLQVDPEFDLFRLLDPREIPPSIGQIFGAPQALAVLPAAESEALEGYRELVAGWASDSHRVETVLDSELEALPADRAVWVLGRRNRLAAELFGPDAVPGLAPGPERVGLEEESLPYAGHSLVVVRRHPQSDEQAVGWLVVDPPAAFAGMGRKLPHYGKYSYLGFEGEEPVNVVKGQWPASGSPLRVDLGAGRVELAAATRTALAELPPVFSQKRLAEHLAFLAAPEREGRGVGGEGLAQAAAYLAERFREIGLRPALADGYLQTFTLTEGPEGGPVEVANVIGYLPGERPEWSDQAVLVSAHYDHLGRGWPDAHQEHLGQIHPGADDNASGVAVLLELARRFAEEGGGARNLVFAAFTAEEADRAGSRHYVESPAPVPAQGIRAVVNLDTVGRLNQGKLMVLGTGTAAEWPHIFRGCSFVTGVESRSVPDSAEGSDQWSFIERGIPGVQIFSSAHDDYHRPGDTLDKVDLPGLVKVATFVREAVEYLVEREEPLTVSIAGEPPSQAGPAGGRRVRLGTVPDFSFAGPGVRVESVQEGSPAERAGLAAGDVLTELDGREVADLRSYSQILKELEPGRTVSLTVLREGEPLTLSATPEAR